MIVDPLTGAMWKLTPEGIETRLEAARAQVTPPLAPPAAEFTEVEEQPAPRMEPVARSDDPSAPVGDRLEALKQRRMNGEMSGEEYLAERNRIIYGE